MPFADVCGNCDATANLMDCKRCSMQSYCSKECQKAHWPRHKLFCNAKFEERKRGKNVVKGEEPKEVTITHLGPVVNIGEGPILPQGVPLGLPIVRKAIYELMSHRIENVQYGEKAYMNVYNDVVQNEEGWLEFCQHQLNENHCLDVCHILNILSDIQLDRNEVEVGGNTNEMSFKFFSAAEQYRDESPLLDKWHATEVAMLKTKYSLNMILFKYTANVPIFRRSCELEIERNLPLSESSDSNFAWKYVVQTNWVRFARNPYDGGEMPDNLLKEMVAWMSREGYMDNYVTLEKAKYWGKLGRDFEGAKTVHDLSDECIEEVLRFMNEISPMTEINAQRDRDVDLKTCGNCNKIESACGEFNRCNRCKSIVYCGKACQVDHWKVHKKVCTKKKK